MAVAITVLHLLTAEGYGIFRDELYYLACAERLDWGYVDHPPLVAVLARVVRDLLGTSLLALRLFPALAAGVLVWVCAAMTRQLGGGRFAEVLAGIAVALAPQYLGMLSIYSMNAFDLVVWAGLSLMTVRILRTDDRWLWLPLGLLAGLGLQNKLSVLFLFFGLALGFLVTGQWKHLRDRRLWGGAALAALLFAPHVLWQAANGWPTAEFIERATATKNVAYAPLAFLTEQVVMMNPVAALLWLSGLGSLFFAPGLRLYRALGWAWVAVLLFMLTRSSKPYYLAPLYPVLFAAGAVTVERIARVRGLNWIRWVVLVAIMLSGAALAPLAKPLLSVDGYVAYAARLGVEPGTHERHRLGRLPQFFADMHGWEELAQAVALVQRALPAEEREQAFVFAQNYGQAGAIEFFGPALGLPPVICGHNSYWQWGPGDCTGEVVIVIGGQLEDHLETFTEVEQRGYFTSRDSMPYESDLILWVARGLRAPVGETWPLVKHFN